MGGGQSTPRKVTIDNPEEPAVIKITENVLERLQGANQQEATKVNTPGLNYDASNTNSMYVSSHQIRKEVDRLVERNNLYWENRLKILRDAYRKINTELEEEYNKAVKEVHQTLGKHYVTTSKSDVESCKKAQNSVIQCYNMNKDRPLLCSEEVRKFNESIMERMNLVSKA